MGYRYIVIGSGHQGTAAAYDLAKFGEAESIVMADMDKSRADSAVARINHLVGWNVVYRTGNHRLPTAGQAGGFCHLRQYVHHCRDSPGEVAAL